MRIYNFNKVVGNTTTVKLIKGSLSNNRFPRFSICAGLPGTGKSTCANIAALSLTCENPINGEPCLKCESCKKNIEAIENTGQTSNVVCKNLAATKSRKDVLELIEEIFVLQPIMGNKVYVLGEFHCLSSADQSAFLEEIDRLDDNTYIILTTSKVNKLLKEIRSRGITFNFNRLNEKECKLLFDNTCETLNANKGTRKVFNQLYEYSRGIPRDLVNLIEFVNENEPTEEEINDFLQRISSEQFSLLLGTLYDDLAQGIELLEEMLNKYNIDLLIEQFKNYIVNLTFYAVADIKGTLTKKDIEYLGNAINPSAIYKISIMMKGLNTNSSESDFKLAMIQVGMMLKNKKVSDVYALNNSMASKQNVNSKKLHSEINKMEQESKDANLGKLDKESLKSMLSDVKKPKSAINNVPQEKQSKKVNKSEDLDLEVIDETNEEPLEIDNINKKENKQFTDLEVF